MGLFTARNTKTAPTVVEGALPLKDTSSSWIALFETKIESLQEKLQQKDAVIEELQAGLSSNLEKINRIEKSSAAISTTVTARNAEFTHYKDEQLPTSKDDNDDEAFTSLTNKLEHHTLEASSLRIKLEEQEMIQRDLHERLTMSSQGKAELASTIDLLEKRLQDQQTQLEALQSVNETNASILKSLGLEPSGAELSDNNNNNNNNETPLTPTTPKHSNQQYGNNNNINNKWEIYTKMQKLMEDNNKLSQALATMAQEKQAAERRVVDAESDNRQLMLQISQLGQQLDQKEQSLAMMQQLNSYSNSDDSSSGPTSNVLSDIQEVLSIFGTDEDGGTTDTDKQDGSQTEEDSETKLLRRTLRVSQSQIQQLHRDRDVFLQKTAKQSVALADSKAQVDTLRGKVEHYESVIDSVLMQRNNNNSGNKSSTKDASAFSFQQRHSADDRRDPITPTSLYDASMHSPVDSPILNYGDNINTTSSDGDNTVDDPQSRARRKLTLPSFLRN